MMAQVCEGLLFRRFVFGYFWEPFKYVLLAFEKFRSLLLREQLLGNFKTRCSFLHKTENKTILYLFLSINIVGKSYQLVEQ